MTVRLVNAIFFARHGVMEEEHRLGGRFEVDVAMDVDFTRAAEQDDLSGTVDYEQVYGIARRVVTEHSFFLIERLAYLIAHGVLDACPQASAVSVTVRKPNPPIGGPADRAEVTYRAARPDAA